MCGSRDSIVQTLISLRGWGDFNSHCYIPVPNRCSILHFANGFYLRNPLPIFIHFVQWIDAVFMSSRTDQWLSRLCPNKLALCYVNISQLTKTLHTENLAEWKINSKALHCIHHSNIIQSAIVEGKLKIGASKRLVSPFNMSLVSFISLRPLNFSIDSEINQWVLMIYTVFHKCIRGTYLLRIL